MNDVDDSMVYVNGDLAKKCDSRKVKLLGKILRLTSEYIKPNARTRMTATDNGFTVCYDTRYKLLNNAM